MRFDYRAYLTSIMNVKKGIKSRHKIIKELDSLEAHSVSDLGRKINLSTSTIRYHLKNMQADGYVIQDDDTKLWLLVELNQSELTQFLKKRRKQ